MQQNKGTKKYSEMTFEEFLTNILKVELDETQIHMVKMFEEVKTKKVEYINNLIPNIKDTFPNDKPWESPRVMYTENTDLDVLKPVFGTMKTV